MDSAEETLISPSPLFGVPELPGTPIGKRLTLLEADGKKAVFFGSVVINVFDADDRAGESACIAMLSRADLASDVDIAEAFHCHRNTVARLAGRLSTEGMAAVVPAKRGPKGPSKVTGAVLRVIEEERRRPAKEIARLVAKRTGVALSASHVSALRSGSRPTQLLLAEGEEASPAETTEPTATETEPVVAPAGARIAAGDPVEPEEPDQATPGTHHQGASEDALCFDPPVTLPDKARGPYMGAALYYPALAALGLLDIARGVFRLPRSERFGVRAVTLTLFFMTLLRKTTLESAKHLRRAAFGAVVGSGRAPAVKTLRRKLSELASQRKGSLFGTRLARAWVERGVVATAYLYVDGHMKVYSGKRRLAQVWNSQRRMPLPGVHSYFVGDADGKPLLFLTEELSTNLAKAMPRIIEAIKEVVGERRFTVIFDRGGYDGKLFAWLTEHHITFITYQRGTPRLPDAAFSRREVRFEGRRVRFSLAEDEVRVGGTGPWRRIVVRTKDGHQTPILTNLPRNVAAARIAALMFARWRQENLFKYMGEHHGLDELVSYGAEPADQSRLVKNPERHRLDRQIAEARKTAAALKAELGEALLDEPKTGGRSAHGLKVAQRGAVSRLRKIEEEIARLTALRKALPTKVTIAETGRPREVMRREHKDIVDRIKIAAYNAEEWMLDRLVAHYPNPHDVRDLLRSFAELSGEIDTTEDGVTVTLDPPDTPLHRRALRGLVEELNAVGTTFPGTDVPVTYEVAMHHSEAVA